MYNIVIHQPEYLPWINLFLKLSKCQKFVFLDNVQYTRRSFQNRNIIVKIVSIRPINEDEKYKITYWVICQMKKVGNLHVSYPDWTKVKTIDKDRFIPFY